METIINAMKEKMYEMEKIRKNHTSAKEEIFKIDTSDITQPESSGENQINRNTNWKLTFSSSSSGLNSRKRPGSNRWIANWFSKQHGTIRC